MRGVGVVALAALLALPVAGVAQPRTRGDAGAASPSRARRSRARRAATATTPRPPTLGTLAPAEAQRVLRAKNDDVRRCYETELAHDPTLHGEVIVRLRVEPDGTVSETTVGGDPSLLRVGRCIERVLRRVSFPQPTGGAATVAAPYVFAAGD